MNDFHKTTAWLECDDASQIPVKASCSIGRATSNQIILSDEKVSRMHALIHRQGDSEFWLVDLGSSNGSYLNGRRVSQPMVLNDGAVIKIGSSTFRFRFSAGKAIPDGESHSGERTVHDIRVVPCWLMVADIEGSTEISRRLPTEQLPIITGRWFFACKQVVENSGGLINKYLGDGFLAYWPATGSMLVSLVGVLGELKRMQSVSEPPFRVVLHYGEVSIGGGPSMGEDSLSGPEVNFVFRMEKLAGSLNYPSLLSRSANTKLSGYLSTTPIGRFPISGFEGAFDFLTY